MSRLSLRRLVAVLRLGPLPGLLLGLITAAALLGALPAGAGEARPAAADPVLEARVLKIAEELRCLVCQNETIGASQADLAVDLRRQIRLQLGQGRSETQILDFMVERYGEFVRYRPALNPTTALLWAGPFVLLAVTAGALGVALRRRQRQAAPGEAFSAAETRRLNELLNNDRSEPA